MQNTGSKTDSCWVICGAAGVWTDTMWVAVAAAAAALLLLADEQWRRLAFETFFLKWVVCVREVFPNVRARWAEPRLPLRKTHWLAATLQARTGELADTLYKQLSISGTVFPLWCFQLSNFDAVKAGVLRGFWLKMICLLSSWTHNAWPCTTCIFKKSSILPTTNTLVCLNSLKASLVKFHYQSTK